jgi:methyl-accepting chemotaxis protein
MLRFIANYPISRRLILVFTLAAILPSVMIATMGIYYVNQLDHRGAASRMMADAQDHTGQMATTLQQMYTQTKILETQVMAGVLTSAATTGPMPIRSVVTTSTNQINTSANSLATLLLAYQKSYDPTRSSNMQSVYSMLNMVAPNDTTPQAESGLLHTFADDWQKYREAQRAELNLLVQIVNNTPGKFTIRGAASQISTHASKLNGMYTAANSDWLQISSYVNRINNEVNGVGSGATQPIIMGTGVAFLLTLGIVIAAGILVQRSITGPLSELVSLTRRISKGDTNARARVTSHDEISIVANSMNNMLDNIVHLIQDTQAQRDVLQGQVEKLVSEVSGVGEGDLRVQAEVTADALGVLADSFNYMVEELGSLVVRVKMVAREVEESTTLTSDRMNELVETSDRQIQQIANAALEIERMAMTSQQVASRALALASSAREARVSAQGGRQAVQQTVEGMGRIYLNVQETSSKVQTLGERSREINNIVEAISNIAHQTNRLALDAAIQAAMAGENGKGFGAVAADIRRLAERAKEQATSVGRIVRSVRDDIGAVAIAMRDTERETSAGTKLAEEAGTSLESIFSVIERQAREIEVINQMAMQQQQSSGEVVQIMQAVSESTQESTTSTRDAAQNMERVARLAEQLLASVEAFKLREGLNYFAPNASFPTLSDDLRENQLTASGSLRTVTATAQAIASGVHYPPVSGGLPTHFPQYSPLLSTPAPESNSNNVPLFLPPGGPQPFPSLNQENATPFSYPPQSRSPFASQGNDHDFSPSQRGRVPGTPSWPPPQERQPGGWPER